MSGGRLPGAPETDDERVVCHVDMDCFYASCERLREPDLVGEPLVVGMGYEGGEQHGAVATASYEAREHGVESAMAISEALERLPRIADDDGGDDAERAAGAEDAAGADGDDAPVRGHYRPVDMAFYREVSEEVRAVLRDAADVVREVSIDEAYLDVTAEVGWDGAEAFAADLKAAIHEAAGVPASVGVAPNMATAKVASDHDKPDGLVVVRPDEAAEFLASLDVRELHGVGPVTARELRELGVDTAGDLAAADVAELVDRFGERGREIHRHARGVDGRAVEPVGDPKSLSSESAFVEATDDTAAKRERVRELAAEVATRARSEDALYKTIGVKVVRPPYDVNTRARSLSGPVDDPSLVESVALDLLEEFADDQVRKLGVRVSNLEFSAADQSSLAAWESVGGTGGECAADGDGGTDEGATDGGDDAWDDDGSTAGDAGPAPADGPARREGQARLGDFD